MNLALPIVALACLSASNLAQQPLNQNLLVNPTFETGSSAPWNPVSGSLALESYGVGPLAPALAVSPAMNGGRWLVRGWGVHSQTIDVTGNAGAIDASALSIALRADLGGLGSDADSADLRARFLNAGGFEIGTVSLTPVTAGNRNYETVLMRRLATFRVPPSTRSIRVELEFFHGGTPTGYADNLLAMLLSYQPPAPLPLGTELLHNRQFEQGWTPLSPLDLVDPKGWRGLNDSTVRVEGYGFGELPLPASQAIGGGLGVLGDYSGGGASIGQVFDLTGNAPEVDAGLLRIALDGCFGGLGSDGETGRLVARFSDSIGADLGSVWIGDVDHRPRNLENVLLRRIVSFPVPSRARKMVIGVDMVYSGGTANGFVDNVSAKLVAAILPAPVPYGTELLSNGDFESGYLANSPLQPNNPNGWRGENSSNALVEPYGMGELSLEARAAIGGGAGALGDYSGGGALLSQTFDLSGNQADVDSGSVEVVLEGYFGGLSTDSESSHLEAHFANAVGAGLGSVAIGGVNYSHRNGEDLMMRRRGSFRVPAGTRSMKIKVRMTYGGGTANGYAENLSAMIMHAQPPAPLTLDLQLLTNPDFESGWIQNSPLQPAHMQGWRGENGSTVRVEVYGVPGTNTPTPEQAEAIGGGSYVLGDYSGGGAILSQTLDVSGNATEVDSGIRGLHLGGFFGGYSTDNESGRIAASFFDQYEALLGSIETQLVSAADRGNVTALLYREAEGILPQGTRTIVVELQMSYAGGTANALCDNVSAVLFDTLAGGPGLFPGSDEGLQLFTGIDGQGRTGPGYDLLPVVVGDVLTLRIDSLDGAFDFAPVAVGGQIFATGNPPVPSGLFGSSFGAGPILVVVSAHGPFGSNVLLPQGNQYDFLIPPGLGGVSVLLQAFALSPQAANGFVAVSDGHEVRIAAPLP